MTFIESIKTCFRKYFDFKGRATRSEFWWFQLFNLSVFGVAVFFDGLLGYGFSEEFTPVASTSELFFLMPVLAVTCRRLHDLGFSGWFQIPAVFLYIDYLGLVIPGFGEAEVIGYIVNAAGFYWMGLFIVCIKRGKPGTNNYGVDPMAPDMGGVFG